MSSTVVSRGTRFSIANAQEIVDTQLRDPPHTSEHQMSYSILQFSYSLPGQHRQHDAVLFLHDGCNVSILFPCHLTILFCICMRTTPSISFTQSKGLMLS